MDRQRIGLCTKCGRRDIICCYLRGICYFCSIGVVVMDPYDPPKEKIPKKSTIVPVKPHKLDVKV